MDVSIQPFCASLSDLSQALVKQGFAVLPSFYNEEELEKLRVEAETALELSGAYDRPAQEIAAKRGCVFEVRRPRLQTSHSANHDGHDRDGSGQAEQRCPDATTSSCPSEVRVRVGTSGSGSSDSAAAAAAAVAGLMHPSGTGGSGGGSSSGSVPLRDWGMLSSLKFKQLVDAALGCQGFFFNEQFIIKPPHCATSGFQWHRDSDWCRLAAHGGASGSSSCCCPGQRDQQQQQQQQQQQIHTGSEGTEPGSASSCPLYVSLWTALDDITPDNGPLMVVPCSHMAECMQPRPCGSGGDDDAAAACMTDRISSSVNIAPQPGPMQQRSQQQGTAAAAASLAAAVPLLVPAGSVVVMCDTVLHASGPNRSRHMRRVWMPQASPQPVRWPSGQLVAHALPVASL